MALSESQVLKVSQILRVNPSDVDYQIMLLATDVTATWQTAVEAELTRWLTAGVDFVEIEPREANFGAKISPNREKSDIRWNLAILFERPDWGGSGGGQQRLQRG